MSVIQKNSSLNEEIWLIQIRFVFYALTSNVVFFLGVSLEGREATHRAALMDKGINLITFINEVNEVNLYTQFKYHFNNCIGVDFISILGKIYIIFVYAACFSS